MQAFPPFCCGNSPSVLHPEGKNSEWYFSQAIDNMSTCGSLTVSWDPENQGVHLNWKGRGRIVFESTDAPQNVLIIKGE